MLLHLPSRKSTLNIEGKKRCMPERNVVVAAMMYARLEHTTIVETHRGFFFKP